MNKTLEDYHPQGFCTGRSGGIYQIHLPLLGYEEVCYNDFEIYVKGLKPCRIRFIQSTN